ncbi:MAG TPA: hypothetical protein VJ912_02915 [Candidatus Nanoarchaeia archaeon]|nr:hypothetical protein [Candidatus Nanoarchaeia archaeon]
MTKGWERKISKKGGDGLASKVLKIPPELSYEDDKGRYIPYCDHEPHKGIIIDENVCINRRCNHYYRFYINKENNVF